MTTIAGHTFDSNDRCCEIITTYVDGVSYSRVCGKRWLDIMHCDESYVGEAGVAHVSTLNSREVGEIAAERARRLKLYENATSGVSGGGERSSVTVNPPVQEDTMMCARVVVEQVGTGANLDRLASLYGAPPRQPNQADESYRRTVLAAVSHVRGLSREYYFYDLETMI